MDSFFPAFSFPFRESDDSTRGNPPENPFLRHACDSVIPVENRSPAFLPFWMIYHRHRSSRHRGHLQRGISIFSIQFNRRGASRARDALITSWCIIHVPWRCLEAALSKLDTRHAVYILGASCRDVETML